MEESRLFPSVPGLPSALRLDLLMVIGSVTDHERVVADANGRPDWGHQEGRTHRRLTPRDTAVKQADGPGSDGLSEQNAVQTAFSETITADSG